MSGVPKRFRTGGGAAGGGGGGAMVGARMRNAFGQWARNVLRRKGGYGARRLGGTYARALARLHAFKRVGVEMQMVNTGTNSLPTLVNAAGSGSFPYLQVGSFSNGALPQVSQFGGAFSFQLAQLGTSLSGTGLTDITNLFDNYRIAKVVLRFDLSYNSAPGGAAIDAAAGAIRGIGTLPIMHICPDYDDNGIPATREAVLENAYARTVRLDRSFTMAITPRAQSVVATGAAGGGVAAGGLLAKGTWLDCSSPQIPHFGIKFWMEDFPTPTSGGANAQLRITPTYYIQAKNVI